jgi:hypothetical protein
MRQDRQLSYNALTRQYRLQIGSAHEDFSALRDAVAALGSVRITPLAEGAALKKGTSYEASVQLKLDTSQLPKPFQVNALASKEWQLASGAYRWRVTL